jgi:hypothetical protein
MKPKDKPPAGDARDIANGSERRRIAKIIHDERGNARVEWEDAPKDAEGAELPRPTLSIDEPEGNVHRGYDPYSRAPRTQRGAAAAPTREPAPKRDLRKLSEWIKQMRTLDERKRDEKDD